MNDDVIVYGHGLYFEEFHTGMKFRTFSRTLTEADLVNFINATGFTEVLFTDTEFLKHSSAIKGRVVPAAMVYSFSEGLCTPVMQGTGLAFLGARIDVKAPTFVNDTIHVEGEVTESRRASKGERGLVRTMNRVLNQKGELVLTYDPLRMIKGKDYKVG